MGKSWEDATSEEIMDARVQSLEEGLEHLMRCVYDALKHGGDMRDAAGILADEWGK